MEPSAKNKPSGFIDKALGGIEKIGNKLPDPAALFLLLLFVVWALSFALSSISFNEIDPRTKLPLVINNQLTGEAIATFLSNMVTTFTSFHPLGVVLVAMLGVGVAEHTGFINASLKALLNVTSPKLLTPMLILVAIISHTAADAGYVLVIPLGAVIFYTAGRHPLAGIAAAFAGVSGGFSASFIPAPLDPQLAALSQSAAQIIDPLVEVNPLSNWFFTASSCLIIVAVGWFITDKIIEPRLKNVAVDGDASEMPKLEALGTNEKKGLIAGFATLVVGLAILFTVSSPADSPMRSPIGYKLTSESFEKLKQQGVGEEVIAKLAPSRGTETFGDKAFLEGLKGKIGEEAFTAHKDKIVAASEQSTPQLTASAAPLMKSIVPLIFLLFILPGIVFGYVSKSVKTHRDVIQGMSKSMSSMGYYIVLAFFAALFIAAFSQSNLGALIALKGANALQSLALPGQVTIIGIIIITAFVNLFIGSASAKWALLAPIFVPMLMELGMSPELSQASYRIGDSSTNIITPLMPYFPLVVVYAKRYVKDTGIGTITSLMIPFSITFLVTWTLFLMIYWALGLPLGLQAEYFYIKP